MRNLFVFALLVSALPAGAQAPDWSKIDDEAMRHFQALVQIDSSDPPGNETRVAEYVKKTLEAEGIPVMLVAKDPARADIIARLKGNGTKRPLLDHGTQRRGPRGSHQVDLPALQRHPPGRLRLRPRHAGRQERSAGGHDDHADAEAAGDVRSIAT